MNTRSIIAACLFFFSCASPEDKTSGERSILIAEQDMEAGTISISRAGEGTPVLVQHAQSGIRPYIHPIVSPDGNGELTEYSPSHHKHQTGLYWGLKQVNGRDYFMNWKEDYWRKVAVEIQDEKGQWVGWRTVYDLLDEKGTPVLTETQTWNFQERDGRFILDLEWKGQAKADITMGKFYVGGLFLRMPWREGIEGEVVNAAGQVNESAEGQRAIWNDIGIRLDGRKDKAHIAILDHPDNSAFPVPWRVDNELGVGPSRQILGDWSIAKGETEVVRYRLIAYTGEMDQHQLTRWWKEYVCEPVSK